MMEDAKKILIVEDEDIISRDIQNRLEGMGYVVTAVVMSGEDAVKISKDLKPDLVLMDIVLGGEKDGIDAAMEIYSHFNIPIVYLSTYANENLLKRMKTTEPFGYVMKPFDDMELRMAIEMAIYKHRLDTEQKRLIINLQKALANIQTLRGLIPICAHCKKIRDDKGYWNLVEKYIQDHTDAEFTHSICPECTKILYPDLFKEPTDDIPTA